MAVGIWTLLPFVTSVFFAAMLHCESHSEEHSHEEISDGVLCTPICKDDDSLKGETFHCVLSNEGNEYKFIARNPDEENWRFYKTDLDSDSSLLCEIGVNGDEFAVSKRKKKCSAAKRSGDAPKYTNQDLMAKSMRQILASQNLEQFDSSTPISRKSSLAVSATGPGSFAQASDGRESLFASGDRNPSAQTSGNAHAFSSDGKTNAESHFGKDFFYPVNGRPTGGRPNDDFMPPMPSMPPFFIPFQKQQPPYPVFGNGLPPKNPVPDYPQQNPGQNSLPFDNVFNGAGLSNPFLMLSGQPPIYNGNRNLLERQISRFYQPPSIDSVFAISFPHDYSAAFLPYMNPFMSTYEAPRRIRTCKRCKREAVDRASEDEKSEENVSSLETQISDEMCRKIEEEICTMKKIMNCNDGGVCCWEDVDFKKCNDEKFGPSVECSKRLSHIFGL